MLNIDQLDTLTGDLSGTYSGVFIKNFLGQINGPDTVPLNRVFLNKIVNHEQSIVTHNAIINCNHDGFFKKMKHNILLIYFTFLGLSTDRAFAQSDTILVGYSQSDIVSSLINEMIILPNDKIGFTQNALSGFKAFVTDSKGQVIHQRKLEYVDGYVINSILSYSMTPLDMSISERDERWQAILHLLFIGHYASRYQAY
ncbi:MAG: hypothetical protein IPH31_12025 [Lewinellaceae bacterium]|nr:hypothetical protein [Lewinellaceae bacterium]